MQGLPSAEPGTDAFPEIGPLLSAANAKGLDARPVLARVLCDLFVARELHTRAELEQFASLIAPLLRSIDTQTAATVARKLSPHAETPREVIEALFAREDEASCEVALAAPLPDAEIDMLAERGSRPIALAIASREALADGTARRLADRDEAVIDLTLARHTERRLAEDVAATLLDRARHAPELARLLLAGSSLRFAQRCCLFLEAEPHHRAEMAAEATRRCFLTRARNAPFARNSIDAEILALAGHGGAALAAALADWIGSPASTAKAIVADSTGEALVIALRACGARPEPIVTLLLGRGVHLARSVERVFALDRLARETSAAGAAMVLAAFADLEPAAARHRPALPQRRDGERVPAQQRTELPTSLRRREQAR